MGSPSEQLALRAQPHHEFDLSTANPTCSIRMERRGTKCCNASAIPTGKSPDPDRLPNKMYKVLSNIIAPILVTDGGVTLQWDPGVA